MKITATSLVFLFCGGMAAQSIPVSAYEIERGPGNSVHETISQHAFRKALQEYNFLQELGLAPQQLLTRKHPVTQQKSTKNPEKWVTSGSEHEDLDLTHLWSRVRYHWYDPHNEGVGLSSRWPNGLWKILLLPEFNSAWEWVTGNFSIPLPNFFTIPRANEYYLKALTNSDPHAEQDWANMFYSLGHIMHLNQDMAQPEHVRNDLHFLPHDKLLVVPAGRALFSGFSVYEVLTKHIIVSLKFDGYPLVKLPTFEAYWHEKVGNDRGLAAFTNTNFVTDDTNIDDYKSILKSYPSPPSPSDFSYASTSSIVKVTLQNGKIFDDIPLRVLSWDYTDYYRGITQTNPSLTSHSIFDFSANKKRRKNVYSMIADNYITHANILLPMATGYSAGLIDHFFRGRMDLVQDPNSDKWILKNLAKKQATPDMDMSLDGVFALYYDYIDPDAPPSSEPILIRAPVPAQPSSTEPNVIFSTIGNPLAPEEEREFTAFDVPTDPPPVSYMLVFQGKIGQEGNPNAFYDSKIKDYSVAGKQIDQTQVVAIAAGAFHSLALLNNGQVWAWGSNERGQLGQGTIGDASPIPVRVKYPHNDQGFLGNIIAIASGSDFSLALGVEGRIWAWGDNREGQLANGTTDANPIIANAIPTLVTVDGTVPLDKVKAITTAFGHGLALDTDKNVWAWGRNEEGQLGIGAASTTDQPSAVQVAALSQVDAIEAGDIASYALINGQVRSFGGNGIGQLGLGDPPLGEVFHPLEPAPKLIEGLTGVQSVTTNGGHALALQGTRVYAWGAAFWGQLASDPSTDQTLKRHGTFSHREIPALVSSVGNVSAIVAGSYASYVLIDGRVLSWGMNRYGNLGDGNYDHVEFCWKSFSGFDCTAEPVAVVGLSEIQAIAAGKGHALALSENGKTIWAWGNNRNGQLGDNKAHALCPSDTDYDCSSLPVQVDMQALLGGQ